MEFITTEIILGALGNALYHIVVKGTGLLSRPSKTEEVLRDLHQRHESELQSLYKQAELKKLIEAHNQESSRDILEKVGQIMSEALQKPEFRSLASDIKVLLDSQELQQNMIKDGFLQLRTDHAEMKSMLHQISQEITITSPTISELRAEMEAIIRRCPHIRIGRIDDLFIGRSAEIADFMKLFQPKMGGTKEYEARIITLCGEGGIGKTRLAQAVADRLYEEKRFLGGIFEVACEGISDTRGLAHAILRAMDISSVERIQHPEDIMVKLLRGQEQSMLFVLDGLDELFAPGGDITNAGRLMKECLAASSSIMFLATCRYSLDLGSDEHIFRVNPMKYQDAVELFILSIPDQEIQAELRRLLEAEQTTLLRYILELTASMPLCVILAARRLMRHGESLETLLEGMANRMVETMNDPKLHHLPERLRSLRASLQLSYDRMSESAKELFACMGFFPGGLYRGFSDLFNLLGNEWKEAAEEAANYGLIRYERKAKHYTMLHPVIEYAREKLNERQGDDFRQQVVEFWMRFSLQFGAAMMDVQSYMQDFGEEMLQMIREKGGQGTIDELRARSMREFAMEEKNLLYAAEWALRNGEENGVAIVRGLEHYLSVRGLWYIKARLYQLALLCLRQLVETDPQRYSPMLVRMLYRRGLLLNEMGFPDKALKEYGEALKICRQLSILDTDSRILPSVASTLDNMGTLYRNLGQFGKALAYCQEALSIYRRLSESSPDEYMWDLAVTLNNIGNIYANMGYLGEALKYHQEALPIRRKLSDLHADAGMSNLAMSLNNIGGTYAKIECFDEALEYLQEALVVYRELSELYPDMYKPYVALTLSNMGAILRSEKVSRLNDARAKYDESLNIYMEFFRRYPSAYAQNYLFALRNAVEVYKRLGVKDKVTWCEQEMNAIMSKLRS
jgi:tetratricopeptide (TPR) repeat protein